MKKKQYLFPKVSLMSCLLLTAMPLQNVLADVPNVQETLLIEGNEVLIDALQNNAYVKLMNGYKEEKLRLIDKRVRPFLRKVYEGNLSEVNAEVDAFVKDIKDNETDVLGIQQSFKSLISTLSPKIGYFTFMQDAKYLEDLGTLTASELDESYLDLLENHVGKHRILVKYENLQEGRIPLEGITVPLKNRIQELNNIQQEIEHLPEVHDSFLYLDKSDYEKKLENLLFLIDLRLSSFVDYDRLAVMMDQEIKPLYTELHAIKKNRQIQMFRDVFPNIEKAESIIKTLDDVTDPKVKYKKLHEILEAYIEKCGDIRKKNILSSILSRYEYLVDSMKEELRNYLETDVFKSSTNSGDKHHNETIKLVNSEEFYNRIYYANSIAELKMIKSDLDLITTFESKKENNSDTDTETTPIKIEKPIESVQPDKEIEKEVSKEGWIKKSNLWYYKEKSGKLATGWKKVSGKWYYLEQSGAMATGWKKVSSKWYYLEQSGAMATGWKKVSGKWYYLEQSGAMATGWKKVSGKWYYLEQSGAMATGWKKVSGKWYYLEPSGAMATGWKKVSGKWYYLEPSGAMATGWKKVSGKWYYLDKSGSMITGSKTIDGKKYTFNKNGSLK